MPSTIPYDPSLVLTSVVHPDRVQCVTEIARHQAPIDAAQQTLSSLVSSLYSLQMTITELQNLDLPESDINAVKAQEKRLKRQVGIAAIRHSNIKIEQEEAIRNIRSKISSVHEDVESPVDYEKMQIKQMPLAADSLNMDVQYFSYDQNNQQSSSHVNNISGFVSQTTSTLGQMIQKEMSGAAARQVNSQCSKHAVIGTLVLSVACTHKMASIVAPCVIDVDKGIKAWNKLIPEDRLNTDDPNAIKAVMTPSGDSRKEESKFSIISGTTFGSSFVGMVHVLKADSTAVNQDMTSLAASLQSQMNSGLWFASESGGFGVQESFANDVKNLLSSQTITSHVTLISMGIIPQLKSNSVNIAVKEFANFDPKTTMEALATLANSTNAGQNSVLQSATAARTGQQMISMKQADIHATLSALAQVDDGANKMLDINSMMSALEDYISQVRGGATGVPINYYLKDITKRMLAEMWVGKYLTHNYIGDGKDTGGQGQTQSRSSGSTGQVQQPTQSNSEDAPADSASIATPEDVIDG